MFSLETLAQTAAPLSRINLSAGLSEFPADLYRFSDSLEILDLSGNQLTDLPADLHRFQKLKRLFLTSNNFRHIPAILSLCPALVMVSFKGNQLTDFAQGVLPEQLEWLILTDNQLSALPEDFGRYTKLRKVALAGNQLSCLPDSMQQCRELGLLRLSLNKFEMFPDWLFELPKLAWLALGALLAAPVFASTVVALPMLVDSRTSVMEAVTESWRAVANHPAPMAFWAVLIGLLVGVGMFTALLGLVVVIPLIAHASWHAYCDLTMRPVSLPSGIESTGGG